MSFDSLDRYSDDALEQELQRRAERKQTVDANTVTLVKFNAEEWETFARRWDNIIQKQITEGYQDDDTRYYLYEDVIMLMYGQDAFKKLNRLF